ncbi:MAG: GNAT family N-acetyltransferase [Sphingomonas sp.]|nr:GNAT family N-acetyltransferase [Sphingomonas sp.]
MESDPGEAGIPKALVETFARGWSVTRGVPMPQIDSLALRIETGLPDERRRYIFTAASNAIGALAARIREPRILVKAPMPPAAIAGQLPPQWHVERTGTMMTIDALPGAISALPDGIAAATEWRGAVFFATLTDAGGGAVGQGRMTLIDGLALHDRIMVEPSYWRRGLGRAIMQLLGAEARRQGVDCGLLTATVAGRALYETLGWQARSPWTTAQIMP